ncbi:hypothetical protein D3C78_964010 [compost metagenome]
MNRANCGRLFRVETQSLTGHAKPVAPVHQRWRFAGKLAQSFFAQCLQRCVIKFQLFNLMTPDSALAQRGQRLLLLRRSFQAVDINGLPVFCRKPVPRWGMAGAFTLTQQNRQRVKQHVANRVVIIIRRPQQQSPDACGVNRLNVEHIDHRF